MLWKEASSVGKGNNPSQTEQVVSQLNEGLKQCYDGAFKDERAAIGVVLRDSNERLLDGIAKTIPGVSSLYAESDAVRQACLLAHRQQLQQVTIDSDNMEVIKLSSTKGVPPWEISGFVEDIKQVANSLNLRFLHKPRAINRRAAHWLAASVLSSSL